MVQKCWLIPVFEDLFLQHSILFISVHSSEYIMRYSNLYLFVLIQTSSHWCKYHIKQLLPSPSQWFATLLQCDKHALELTTVLTLSVIISWSYFSTVLETGGHFIRSLLKVKASFDLIDWLYIYTLRKCVHVTGTTCKCFLLPCISKIHLRNISFVLFFLQTVSILFVTKYNI